MNRAERQDLIDWAGRELSVVQQANVLEMNRRSLCERPQPPSLQEIALKYRINAIYTTLPLYGSRRIAAQLHRVGWEVARKTVA